MSTADKNLSRTGPVKPRRRLMRSLATLTPLLIAIVAVLAIRARWFSGASQAAPAVKIESPDDVLKRQMLGSWRDDYYGERTMTFLEDGTGTMLIKLDPVSRLIIGEKLLFHLAWTLTDGVMTMRFTGGEPKGTVETISKEWGDTHHQAIETLTDTDLWMRSTDSGNLYMLKRLPNEGSADSVGG